METADLLLLLDQLDDSVDDLEEALGPLLNTAITETSKKLPVLDKAKYHVLVTYALESLIFSYLRLNGVKAKDHPVFRELTRVKQYFEKIKALETEPEQRTMTLDKQAAARFIKHSLAGNDKLDMQRKEQEAKEKARAQLKASLLAKKEGTASGRSSKNPTSDSGSQSNSCSDDEAEGEASTERPKITAQPTGLEKQKKMKNSSENVKSKQKKKRSKEGRSEVKRERRKKKREARKAKKTSQ
ncbi:hypothetical protein EYZ11_002482 [Aspergillus tanneri]|uniref:Exosome complex protein n=1 Tax=Aspergillus tanneri TaxID=1220188 RepID=A0A4S3JQU5_9EURO|nr:uncharacterized protein ATNIH1004_007078 [Aspergillus tanneri]KAA8645659.1 hypothetical protein ATNIH1004_007078 [Aspergillus tanneri]THC98056.1 hypothetical protein EYZ11_002482 [Aspergillus tanneri]